ncbi:MAG: filamentous hemagglutinin N-terminal domain-containing protein, partial [Gammaproteobacteria bacterium]|nr:filamentous hemagglutinin N-terminal domain-containing protein [Gammaproteobacteria bacterium]
MNRTYALVWNPSLAAWTVTDERARRRGKGAGAVLAAALLLPLTAIAADLPSGGQVVAGSGAINQPNASQMVIDQASNKLAIDWQSFDIAAGNKVTFNQPGRDAIALNRVLGADGSKIMGQLDANGRVFLINPNGVLFGAGAQVNVGGLVASTLNISDSDFEAGNYKFKGNASNASVTNNGQISAADGGSIALLGGTVSNNGVIVANQGTVALAAGNAVTLDFAGDGLLNVQVDEAVVDALVENHQLIKADGGQVLLTANAGDALLKTVVNNTGVIEAQTLGEKDGKIVLLGSFDGGTVQVAGTLDASAPNGGNGGFIETSGAHVKVADGAKVTTKAASGKTGTWLIDPTDFTVSAGNASKTDSGIGATTLSTTLNTTSVTLQTIDDGSQAGDINVNAAVTWNATTTLTLNAHNNININAAITAQHATGKVALKYGQATTDGGTADYRIKAPINLQSGNNFSTQKGSTGAVISYTVVNDAAALQAMNNNLAGNYAVGSNIDLSSINNWVPVGNGSSSFSGQFAGLGHTLSNLTISRSSEEYVGLFGRANNSVIRDIGLVGGNVTGAKFGGGLAGSNDNGATISNAYASGVEVMTSGDYVGGLVGNNYGGRIINAYATGSVSGNENVGGLAGGNDNSGTISNAYATGSVNGQNYVGGLVGRNAGNISNAYATGNVTGGAALGGLVGYNLGGTINNAYATGSVSGPTLVGGLVGWNQAGTISNAYWDSISTGKSNALGVGSETVTDISSNRYNHTSYTGLGTWAPVTGTSNVYAASDSNGVQWMMVEGQTRPFLASEYSTSISNAHQLQLMAYNLGAHYTLAKDIDASATSGSNASGMWSTSGFVPVGDNSNPFTGTFNGLSHTISDLVINRSGTSYVGLFGYTSSASMISDIGLVGGSVQGRDNVGGMVGYNDAIINNAYVTANVSGQESVGGIAGVNTKFISNAYTSGNVSGTNYVGGVVGYNSSGAGGISNTYTTGSVSGSSNVGGLAGLIINGFVSSSFYATTDAEGNPINNNGDTVAGFGGNAYGTGKTWAELKQASTFTGWNIATTGGSNAIWRIYDGHSGPLLRSFLKSVTVTVNDVAGKTYDSTTGSVAGASYNSSDNSASLLGSASYTSVDTRNAGTYELGLSGLYSNQQGYDITVAAGSYTIAKANLAITGISASDKTYDTTTTATLSGSAGASALGTDVVTVIGTGAGAFADKNAGVNKAVTVTGYSLSGTDADNY